MGNKYKKATGKCQKCKRTDATYSKLTDGLLCPKHRKEELKKWAIKKGLITAGIIVLISFIIF